MRPGYINSSRWWRRGRGEGRAQYPSTGPRGAITFAWLTTSVSVRPYPRCLVSLVVIVVRHPDKTYRGGNNFGPRLRELAPRSGGGMTTNFCGHLCTYVIRTTCQVGRGHSMTDQMTPRAGHARARARSRSLSLGLSTLRLSVE